MGWASAPRLAAAAVTAAAVTAAVVSAAVVSGAAAPAAASVPVNARFHSSARFGTWHTGRFFIDNDAWNPAAGPQTIWADSRSHWGAESTQPAGNKAVMTYPNVARNFSNVPLSKFSHLRNGYAESMPAGRGLDAEAADDIWLNGRQIEVMIWVDNHGQRPAGTVVGNAAILGQKFSVWHGGRTWTLLLDHRQAAGQTRILAALRWLVSHQDIPASATVAQVGFGWEVVSTDGRPMDFTMSRYWLMS
jgi:hypothetical protein